MHLILPGPVTHLWREARKLRIMCPMRPRLAARAIPLRLSQAARGSGFAVTLELDSPDMQLDVGGIAKGYAADQALATLSKLGIRSALIAVEWRSGV